MKKTGIRCIGAALALSLSGCGSTDVVARFAQTSFAAVIEASGNRVSWSGDSSAWVLSSPLDDQVQFASSFSGGPDMAFSFDAAPFLSAGLDMAKLPKDGVDYVLRDGRFSLHFELGSDAFSAVSRESLAGDFSEIVRTRRELIGYHEALDHYGIKLGNGNMFEWAKDLSKNDKDIVFVLNPEPLITAGVDPAKVEGWVFAKVEMKDKGRKVFVDRLLKPFNLK